MGARCQLFRKSGLHVFHGRRHRCWVHIPLLLLFVVWKSNIRSVYSRLIADSGPCDSDIRCCICKVQCQRKGKSVCSWQNNIILARCLMMTSCSILNAGSFSIAYEDGGPATAVWGWISVALMNIFVALSMAEIVSAYPIAGGPYFW